MPKLYLKNCQKTGSQMHHALYNFRKRSGICGAWSFDVVNEVCYLHNIDSCCGQKDKQEVDDNFISGYTCKQCWSTRNDCPCTLAERQLSALDGKQISAGAKPKTVTSTVRYIHTLDY